MQHKMQHYLTVALLHNATYRTSFYIAFYLYGMSEPSQCVSLSEHIIPYQARTGQPVDGGTGFVWASTCISFCHAIFNNAFGGQTQ